MDPSNLKKQEEPEEPRFLDFPHLPDDATTPDGKPRLNKYSATLTKEHDFPGAQVDQLNCFGCVCLTLAQGNALCCWCSGPRNYEE